MRRSTAAAVGTVAGAALILGVRLSATPVQLAAPEQAAVEAPTGDQAGASAASPARPSGAPPSSSAPRENGSGGGDSDDEPAAGLKNGKFTGKPATNPYGQVTVSVTVSGGKVTAASATYPTTGQSASINAGAIPKLRQATLAAQSAEIDAVSGATFTSEAYTTSLQAALDAAKA
jgi:uncharacterized protein with FMN-binding domain